MLDRSKETATTKPILNLADRRLEEHLLILVYICDITRVDGNIIQELAAIDKLDVSGEVLMVDLRHVIPECMTILISRRNLVLGAQLEERLGSVNGGKEKTRERTESKERRQCEGQDKVK